MKDSSDLGDAPSEVESKASQAAGDLEEQEPKPISDTSSDAVSGAKKDVLTGVNVPSKDAPMDEKLQSMKCHMQWSLDNAEQLVADRPLDPIPLEALEE